MKRVCGRIHGHREILARNNRDHGRTGYAEGCDHQDERSLFHGHSLVISKYIRLQLSAVYQRCNSGHRDDDFIEFLRRHARGWAVPPKADIELRELNVRQGPKADMGLIRSAYRRAATSLVHRLGCLEINRQLERTRCRSIGKFGGAWRHAI